jgi:microsomal dipeptidase-like Zn-dependent dipeptidase
MEIAHETDSRFAGAAHHHGMLLSIMDSLKSLGQADLKEAINEFKVSFPDAFPLGGVTGPLSGPVVLPKLKVEAAPFNSVGLLPEGKNLLQEMARRKMLFEIDHCSRKARTEIHQYFTNSSSYSHAEGFDSKEDTGEYMPTQQEVSRMQTVGGVFGVRTGPNAQLPFRGSPVANRAHTSGRSVAQIVSMGKSMGLAMALGTDMMGFVPQSGARFRGSQKHAIVASGLPRQSPDNPATDKPVGGSALNEYDVFGLRHVGLEPDLLDDLENLGLRIPEMKNSAERVLRMWERCYQPTRSPLTPAQYRQFMDLPN